MKATVTSCTLRRDEQYLVTGRVFPGALTITGVSTKPFSEGQTVNIKDGKVTS